MIEVTKILWPYGFMAVVWSIVCGSLLLRTIKTETKTELEPGDSDWLWEGQPAVHARDTQAGRI